MIRDDQMKRLIFNIQQNERQDPSQQRVLHKNINFGLRVIKNSEAHQ